MSNIENSGASASKTLVQQQFGANAANYVVSSVHAKGASLQRLVELVSPESSWTALDIATGGGHTALAFAPHVSHVTASDLTEEMLEQVRKQVTEKGLGNVGTARADAEHLPFSDATFDLVSCRIAPHHFPDIPKFVSEVHRVLTPGGVFALVDNISPDAVSTPGFSDAELKEAAATYNSFEKIRDPSHGRAWQPGEWADCIAATGFEITHQEFLPKAMNFDTWCRNMSVPAGKVPGLEAMLRDGSPAFKAYIKPEDTAAGLGFTLTELMVIARKAA
ncbi:MAG TPA: methyltransferase domain-containing protein [Hyphomicrobiaceae bacterium]|nr:methyltransferase domain-containing protein [Hyphomicrobiaceae bacterium]